MRLLDEAVVSAEVAGHLCLFHTLTRRTYLLSSAAQRAVQPLLGVDVALGDLIADIAADRSTARVVRMLVGEGVVEPDLARELAERGDA